MSGLCGWFNVAQDPAAAARPDTARRMAAELPQQQAVAFETQSRGLVCSAGADSWVAADPDAMLLAAISGRPHWSEPELAAAAAKEGDARALLSAYRKYGDALLQKVSGSFALAVVDEREDRALLAVDRMGIRPLCYAQTADGGLVLGSTATSVVSHPAVHKSVSNESIYRFFYFHVVPSPATIFEGVYKLEPGEQLIAEGKVTSRSFYWQPQPGASRSASSEEDILEAVRNQTRAAVARSAPDAATGCFLSGGLDSSTVSGLANEMTPEPIRVYTIGFDQQGYDETTFARAAASHFGLEHIEYYVTPQDVAAAFDALSTAYDEPFGNSSAIPALFCARKAREDGVTRLLAGDGGDELFGGNERYATQRLFEHYHKIPEAIRRYLVEPPVGLLPKDRPVLLRKIRRYVEQARLAMPDRLFTYNFLEMFPPGDVFDPQFLGTVETATPTRECRDWYQRSGDFDFLDRMLLFDWKLTVADNDIRKVNRMCELAGVTVDYPLLDDELVAFSLGIPANMKLRGRELRYAFRKAHENYLPKAVLEKDKHGFGLPFGEWLKSSDELRARILPAIDRFRERGILRNDFIDEMQTKHRHEHAGYFGNMLWLIAVLETWLASKSD